MKSYYLHTFWDIATFELEGRLKNEDCIPSGTQVYVLSGFTFNNQYFEKNKQVVDTLWLKQLKP